MKITRNEKCQFNIIIETDLSPYFYKTYLERIMAIKGWVKEDVTNKERAEILLDAMLILEKVNKLCIAYDFSQLWNMVNSRSKYN